MEGVKIVLSTEKSLELFHDALCNGLNYINSYGISVDWNNDEFKAAKSKLKTPCLEDILIQVLKDGNVINFAGEDGTTDVTLEMVLERIPKVELDTLLTMIQEQGDALTADNIIQTVVYGEVIYG
tara:strand:- start:217 stop:591 length:375 start_codon:yes stop_codon:yes gene_type:complete